jgi:ATP synthase F1 delta subunit
MATISNNDIANALYLGAKNKTGKDLEIFITNTVSFLFRKKLLSKSSHILEKLEKKINKEQGIIKVKISSVSKLDENIKRDLSTFLLKKYNAKNILFTEEIDVKFIGGIKIEIDDEVIDLTIFNKLKKLKTHLLK